MRAQPLAATNLLTYYLLTERAWSGHFQLVAAMLPALERAERGFRVIMVRYQRWPFTLRCVT